MKSANTRTHRYPEDINIFFLKKINQNALKTPKSRKQQKLFNNIPPQLAYDFYGRAINSFFEF